MSILYAISIVYIAGEYDGPGFCTPIGIYAFYQLSSPFLNGDGLDDGKLT